MANRRTKSNAGASSLRWTHPAGLESRRGSVLIVVIGLLLLLMLIGITFFTFSSQEHSSAEYYADSAKVFNVAPNSDVLFDWALEQLIIGPWDSNQQSVLWPGRHSLVPNMLGMFAPNGGWTNPGSNGPTQPTDRHMFNGGTGINFVSGPGGTGAPNVDQGFDGSPDSPAGTLHTFLQINLSAAAQLSPMGAGTLTRQTIFNSYPAIDVGYTYADLNNVFLAHVSTEPSTLTTVVTPSFVRPQILRDVTSGSSSGAPLIANPAGSNGAGNWQIDMSQTSTDTTTRTLRPHPAHVNVVDKSLRYILPASLGGSTVTNVLGNVINPFPFQGTYSGQMGLWSKSAYTNVDYDVDQDGDGIKESVWVDLNFPVMTNTDGRKMIPMFAYLVLEGDSLIPLNSAGNTAWLQSVALSAGGHFYGVSPSGGTAVGSPYPISRSNYGVSPTEINPFWALTGDPSGVGVGAGTAMQQYRGFFNVTTPALFNPDRVDIANADMAFLLMGRPNYNVAVNAGVESFTLNNAAQGLWGDQSNLITALTSGNTLSLFPRPGIVGFDDNGDRLDGVTEDDQIFFGSPTYNGNYDPLPPFAQPFDFTGAGQWLINTPSIGMTPNLFTPVGAGNLRLLQYYGYASQQNAYASAFATPASQAVYTSPWLYEAAFGGLSTNYPPGVLSYNATYYTNPAYSTNAHGIVDEAAEVVTDSRYQSASNPADQLFPASENAALQLSATDWQSILGQSRVRQLASWNFTDAGTAGKIRQRFTTSSWDRRHHGFAYETKRPWEYGTPFGAATSGNNWDSSSGGFQFPPRYNNATVVDGQVPMTTNANLTAEPIRMELAALIGTRWENSPSGGAGAAANTAVGQNSGAFNTPAYNMPTNNAGMTPWQQQLRLNVNRFLTTRYQNQSFGTGIMSNPVYFRELTPHPTSAQWGAAGSTAIKTTLSASGAPTVGGTLDYIPANFNGKPALQEYWARRDRQQMARDIYVLLYLFGGGYDKELDTNNDGVPDVDLNGNGTVDVVNYATFSNSGNKLYQTWQLVEMAQYAVNVVDALDRDDTITVFEYDGDLSNGWNLDDDPMTADVSGDRGVVYGVEAQQLAFNEALVIVARRVLDKNGGGKDHPATAWDDSIRDRTFTYLELQNISANNISLANRNWQIMSVTPGAPNVLNPITGNGLRLLTLTDGTVNAGNGLAPGNPYSIGSFTYISGTDDTPPLGGTNQVNYTGARVNSKFVVDTQWNYAGPTPDTNLQDPVKSQIVPANQAPLSLDLVYSPDATRFLLTNGSYNASATVGDFVDFGVDATAGPFNGNYQTTFVLRRRLNMNRPAPAIVAGGTGSNDELDNPWIEVDRITYANTPAPVDLASKDSMGNPQPAVTTPGAFFNLRYAAASDNLPNEVDQTMALAVDILPKLQRLASRERRQPLDGYEGAAPPSPAPYPPSSPATPVVTYSGRVPYYSTPGAVMNTVGSANSKVPGTGFNLWQPHFDRDFASVMDLLTVPLYAPFSVTQSQAPQENAYSAINGFATEAPSVPTLPMTSGSYYMPMVAQAKFCRPQHPYNTPGAPGNPQFDNRWHRVLELLEVPTRSNMYIENTLHNNYQWLAPYGLQRVPGRMNPNGMRYGENLFALLDDPFQFKFPNALNGNTGYNATIGSYTDNFEATRNWWQEMLKARDQQDPYTMYYLPGSTASRPFRSFSFLDNEAGVNSLSSIDDTLLRKLELDNGTVDQRRLFEARSQTDLLSKGGANSVDYYSANRLTSKIAGNTTPRSNVFLVWVTIGFFEVNVPNAGTPTAIQIGDKISGQNDIKGFYVVDRSLLEDAWDKTAGVYDFRKFITARQRIQ